MRHRKNIVKLNRTSSHRKAMFRNMVTSLFKYERIQTTDAKAKELRRWADHLVTLAKKGDLHARRQALAIIREKQIVYKLFDEVNNWFGDVSGGYTRVIKLGRRPGDAAPVSIVELSKEGAPAKKKKRPKKKADDATKKTETKADVPVEETPAAEPAEEAAAEAAQEASPEKAQEGEAAASETEPAEAPDEKEAAPGAEASSETEEDTDEKTDNAEESGDKEKKDE